MHIAQAKSAIRDNVAKEMDLNNGSGTCSQLLTLALDPTVHSTHFSLYKPGMFERVQM